jgi:hypothetical protein
MSLVFAAAAGAGCRHLYISNCAIGISALLFALKVVLNHDAPTYSSFMGFSLPTKVRCGPLLAWLLPSSAHSMLRL